MSLVRINKHKHISTSETEISPQLIKDAIDLHRAQLVPGYVENEDMYMSNHEILRQPRKEAYKPDNRLVFNYAKYIVDVFGGYHMGIPIKMSHEDEQTNQYIADFRLLNDMADTEYELAKDMDIFGHSFAYIYQDEESRTRVTYESPLHIIMLHDDTIQANPLFAIRYETNEDGSCQGEIIDDYGRCNFISRHGSGVVIGEPEPHPYSGLPVIEFIENEERQGLFDSVKTLINGLNKAASEKANDVDYFADSYLKVIGIELDEDSPADMRDSRIINLYGDAPKIDAQFMEKPNADQTQENLIKMLKDSIFAISMVANMTEEDFGNASGTALAFKLLSMSNLAKMKDRKMQSAFNSMYEVVFSVAPEGIDRESWKDIQYTFSRNVPKNEKEEAEIVALLDGHVSDERKLSYLSTIDDPKKELEKLDDEREHESLLYQRIRNSERMTDDVVEETDGEGDGLI